MIGEEFRGIVNEEDLTMSLVLVYLVKDSCFCYNHYMLLLV